MKNLIRLLSFLKPSARQVFLSLMAGLATIAAGVGMLGTSAYLISAAALHPSIAELQVAIVGVRFFGISRGVFRYAERLVSHSVNLKVLSNIRVWFYQHLEPLAPARLQESQSGDLLQRAVGDIEILENFYVRFVMPLIVGILASLAASLFISTLYAPLGWILAAGLIVNGFILPGLVLLSSRKSARVLVQSQAEVSAAIVEYVQSQADLQLFGADQDALNQVQLSTNRHTDMVRRSSMLNSLADGMALLVTHLTMLSALWVLFAPVSRGEISGILLAVAALLILSSFEATSPLPLAARQLNASLEAAGRIFDLVEPSRLSERQNPEIIPAALPQKVLMQNVTFHYGNESDAVLRNVSLTLERGRKVALVGSSGAGKSTIVNLLLRFWKPDQGVILVDDEFTADMDGEWLRRQFGVINQGTTIFNLSLRDNLLLANPQASDEEIIQALSKAEMTRWFGNLPGGLDTYLGELGSALSAGERQRLGITRLLLQNPPFLLLDEPVSNLDALTGSAVLNQLFKSNPHAGVLYITHDLLQLEDMDEILLMKDGWIIERGNYSELIRADSIFARLVEIQKNSLGAG
jgi:ATP-binding cassette subfamily C protein CydC